MTNGVASCNGTHPAVAGTDIVKRYGDLLVLDHVSVSVAPGEFLGIVGPNGAGKTTLIEILEGLRKADSGSVEVLGQRPWPRNPALLARMAVHTQTPAFFPLHTVAEHIGVIAALYGHGQADAARALDRVGLGGKRDSRAEKLSGGEKQRLALACVLVHDPQLLFLDEPTAALDTEARATLMDLLRGLKAEGITAVYTTHQMSEAQTLCDRVAILARGQIVASDTPLRLIRTMDAPTKVSIPVERLTPTRAMTLPGAESVRVEGELTVISTREPGKVLRAIGELVGLDDVETVRGTLEDVYLRLTGSEQS
jgi:ABC-2 type transport system ATP-binding protein